jgi:hypothetical protein
MSSTWTSDQERHLAAVAGSLASAEDSAARGDYADALAWIEVIEAVGDQIPHEFQTKRDGWLAAEQDRNLRDGPLGPLT